jgi:hypothetical protein
VQRRRVVRAQVARHRPPAGCGIATAAAGKREISEQLGNALVEHRHVQQSIATIARVCTGGKGRTICSAVRLCGSSTSVNCRAEIPGV